MKNLLLLLSAVAMIATFSMAEGKCNGKAGTATEGEKKCAAGKTMDKKKGGKCASGKDENRTKTPAMKMKEEKCNGGKCDGGKVAPKTPAKKCNG